MTTRKQMLCFAIALVKEINISNKKNGNKNISLDIHKKSVNVWFYEEDTMINISMYNFFSLKENKKNFKKAILRIRG